MVMDARQQNKNLRAAAAQPKDTSHRLNTATNYSAKVSSTKRIEDTESSPSNVTMDKKASRRIQGSYEGLMKGSSTHLQPNGVGYDNPKHQKARYKDRSIRTPSITSGSIPLPLDKNYSIMNNYSSQTMKDSSSDRLKSVVDLNMMFK